MTYQFRKFLRWDHTSQHECISGIEHWSALDGIGVPILQVYRDADAKLAWCMAGEDWKVILHGIELIADALEAAERELVRRGHIEASAEPGEFHTGFALPGRKQARIP